MAQYVIGDIHGQFASFCRLLQGAGLVDGTLAWAGGDAALLLMGDFFDRGPHGLAAVDLTMRLQAEAAEAGGKVDGAARQPRCAHLSGAASRTRVSKRQPG